MRRTASHAKLLILLSPSQFSALRVSVWSLVFVPAGQAQRSIRVSMSPSHLSGVIVPAFPSRHPSDVVSSHVYKPSLPKERVTKSRQAPAGGKVAPIGSAQRSGLFLMQLAELNLYKVGVDCPSPHCLLSGATSSALPFLLHAV